MTVPDFNQVYGFMPRIICLRYRRYNEKAGNACPDKRRYVSKFDAAANHDGN
jgi:hypothetical protein